MLTEKRLAASLTLDRMDTFEIVELINRQDGGVADAVGRVLSPVAAAAEGIFRRLAAGGRLLYVGAGTSGRLGMMDAAECPPTFGVGRDLVQAVVAGGAQALTQAVEGAEDHESAGEEDLKKRNLSSRDAVVGISASGATPYTLGALRFARRLGAFSVALSCNERTPLSEAADVAIEVLVGPEVVTGSTRMKAGTAQKMVLNAISTAVMVRLGCVYSNLMVNLPLANRKLVERGIRIVSEATGVARKKALEALRQAGDVRSAIVMLELDCSADEARGLVSQSERLHEILKDR